MKWNFEKMKGSKKLIFTVLLFTVAKLGFSQQPMKRESRGSHSVKTTFGGIAKGEIDILDHLEDSLAFTDPYISYWFRVVSFHLAVKCNGVVLKYMENKSGNKLTAEMKEAIRELHNGCSLTFDGIKTVDRDQDMRNIKNVYDFGMLKLTLK